MFKAKVNYIFTIDRLYFFSYSVIHQLLFIEWAPHATPQGRANIVGSGNSSIPIMCVPSLLFDGCVSFKPPLPPLPSPFRSILAPPLVTSGTTSRQKSLFNKTHNLQLSVQESANLGPHLHLSNHSTVTDIPRTPTRIMGSVAFISIFQAHSLDLNVTGRRNFLKTCI